MRRTTIPVGNLFAWAKLNGVEFHNVDIETDITANDGTARGGGLVSTNDYSTDGGIANLVTVPHELILSQEQVQRYAAIDQSLSEVLDAAGEFGQVRAY
jgi:hypothetical protein